MLFRTILISELEMPNAESMPFTLGFARRLTLLRRSAMHEGVLRTNPLLLRRSATHIGVPGTKERALAATVQWWRPIICVEVLLTKRNWCANEEFKAHGAVRGWRWVENFDFILLSDFPTWLFNLHIWNLHICTSITFQIILFSQTSAYISAANL